MFRQWPYTNFHELNLSWIISEVKKLAVDVTEVKEFRNDWDERLANIETEYNDLMRLYYQLQTDNNLFKIDITGQFNTLKSQLERELADFRTEIDSELASYKRQVNNSLEAYNIELSNMSRRLDSTIQNLWMNLKMINPFTGYEETVITVIDYLASLHMTDGITAENYDALELTAQVYDAKELTAKDYDTEANILLRN